MLLGSCMPNFIEVAHLERCQKNGRTIDWKKKDTRYPQLISAKIQSLIKSEIFFTFRHAVDGILSSILFFVHKLFFDEADMNGIVSKMTENCRITVLAADA